MKKIIFCLGVMFSMSFMGNLVLAGDPLPLEKENYDPILLKNKLSKDVIANETSTQKSLKTLFSTTIIGPANMIFGAIGIVWLVIIGAKFLFSQGEDENLTKYKTQIGWVATGLMVISLANFAGYSVFNIAEDDLLKGKATGEIESKAKMIVDYFQYLVGGIVLLMGVFSAYNLITRGEEDEAVTEEKNFVKSVGLGLVIILLSEVIVTSIFFKKSGSGYTVDATQGVKEISGLIDFFVTFIGGAALFMVVLSTIYYVTSFGDDDRMNRAKSMIIASVVAIMVVFSSYTIARFLIT